MKYIKLIYTIVWLVAIVQIINFAGSIFLYSTDFGQNLIDASKETIFGIYSNLIVMVSVLFLIIGLIYLIKALHAILSMGSFNNFSDGTLKLASSFFVISGILELIFHLIVLSIVGFYEGVVGSITADFFIIIIGLSLRAISAILQDGKLLQQESDLVI